MLRTNHKILSYPVIFEPAQEGGYNVSFPAFPGCVTFGHTFEEAKNKAKEVLELWIEELSFQKEEIPVRAFYPIVDKVTVNLPTQAKICYASNSC